MPYGVDHAHMSRRVDYYEDPDAPRANSMVPSVNVVVENNEARREFSILLTARPTGGGPTPSSESSDVVWTPVEAVAELQMDRSMRRRLGHYVDPAVWPHFG
ncbi:MAG TPA: hypothetical protein VGP36_04065 [Mycobacteriales bacterium]|nr:hypothetical protein [Mycobacteriales bacterium]